MFLRKENNKTSFTRKDYLLIGLLSVPFIVSPWVTKWHEFLIPIFVSGKKSVSRDYVQLTIHFSYAMRCLWALFVCFIADLLEKHYTLFCINLGLYTLAQIYGMIIYYTGPYDVADIAYWLSLTIFTSGALGPYLVFRQNLNARRSSSHLIFTSIELTIILSNYVLFWVVSDRHRALFVPLENWELVPWVAVLVLMAVIAALRFLRASSPVGHTPDPRLKTSTRAMFRGMKEDPEVAKFGLFLTFLVSAIVAMGVYNCALHIDKANDGTKDIEQWTDHMILLGRIAGLVVVEVILFTLRRLDMRLSDVLSLGLPLVFFLGAITTLYIRLKVLRPLQDQAIKELQIALKTARIFEGPIPNEGEAVIEFYNTMDYAVEIYSPDFVLEGPLVPFARVGVGVYNTSNIPIKVYVNIFETSELQGNSLSENATGERRMDEHATTPKCLCASAKIDAYRSYIIHGDADNIQMFHIFDHQLIRPQRLPTIVMMNNFMRPSEEYHRILVWEENAGNRDVAYYQTFSAFGPNNSLVTNVPIGGIKITYENLNEDFDSRNPGRDESTNVLLTEPFVVYTILITSEKGKAYMDSYEIMRVSVRTEEGFEIPKIQHDRYVFGALFLMGGATSSLFVAIFHHFWLDSPARLRATLLAVYISIQSLSNHLTDFTIKRLEIWHVLSLVIAQAAVVVFHFVFSSIYFFWYKYDQEENRDNQEKPMKSRSDLSKSEAINQSNNP